MVLSLEVFTLLSGGQVQNSYEIDLLTRIAVI